MDQELKAKWLEALRSGQYKQGTGSLRDEQERFCCLGVLADVGGEKWTLDETQGRFELRGRLHRHRMGKGHEYSYGAFSQAYQNKVGLDDALACKLMHLNDVGKSFNEIADVIEAEA